MDDWEWWVDGTDGSRATQCTGCCCRFVRTVSGQWQLTAGIPSTSARSRPGCRPRQHWQVATGDYCSRDSAQLHSSQPARHSPGHRLREGLHLTNSSQQLLIAVRLHCIDAFCCYTCLIFHGLCFSASVWGILVNPAKSGWTDWDAISQWLSWQYLTTHQITKIFVDRLIWWFKHCILTLFNLSVSLVKYRYSAYHQAVSQNWE